jgi:Cu/Ag efflux protein CusF
MTRLVAALLIGAVACAPLSCSSAPSAHQPPAHAAGASAPPTGGLQARTVEGAATVRAKVVRIEPKRRVVMLEMADGRRVTVRAHARIADLEALKPGDLVEATYYESIAYDVQKAGAAKPGFKVAEVGALEPGSRPAAGEARAVTVTARINAVDQKAGTVTLAAADANPVTIRVKDPRTLADIKTGDLVQITYTESVAISLDRQVR